jgi:hypothetical protein
MRKRLDVTDGGGSSRWCEARRTIEEGRDFDGSSWISRATGSRWDHERLHRTMKGSWVVERWSQRQGVLTTAVTVSDSWAAEWLLKNGYGAKRLKALGLEEYYAKLEV